VTESARAPRDLGLAIALAGALGSPAVLEASWKARPA